ncbi:hypothetical protein P4S70_16925 [Enterovibrio sp. Hal110]
MNISGIPHINLLAERVHQNDVHWQHTAFMFSPSKNKIRKITKRHVAVAGVAGVSPFELVKRTAIPMVGALIVSTAASLVIGV